MNAMYACVTNSGVSVLLSYTKHFNQVQMAFVVYCQDRMAAGKPLYMGTPCMLTVHCLVFADRLLQPWLICGGVDIMHSTHSTIKEELSKRSIPCKLNCYCRDQVLSRSFCDHFACIHMIFFIITESEIWEKGTQQIRQEQCMFRLWRPWSAAMAGLSIGVWHDSQEYSIDGTVEFHVNSDGTVISYEIPPYYIILKSREWLCVCNVQLGLKTLKQMYHWGKGSMPPPYMYISVDDGLFD